MNKETLERANEIVKTIENLDKLSSVMYVPYPQFESSDRSVNSACFEKATLEKLKEVIQEFIKERRAELTKEFEDL